MHLQRIRAQNFRAFDLPPLSRTNRMEVRSVNQENDGYEEESIYRATDRWLS